jgi:hypothetical protein
MKVRDLIKQLGEADPNARVTVLDTSGVIAYEIPIKYVDETLKDGVLLVVEIAEGEDLDE